MELRGAAKDKIDAVLRRFQSGDLSPVVEMARIAPIGGSLPSAAWSLSDRVIAYMQSGQIDCRGYNQWQAAGRQVKAGSTAVYILGPLTKITTDADTDEKTVKLFGFKPIAVFSIDDTAGEDVNVVYAPRELPPLNDLAQRLGIAVSWQPATSTSLGSCTVDGAHIELNSHDVAVFFHELAHAVHSQLDSNLHGGQHADQETIAEFTACVLSELYGYPHSGNAWRYIASYNPDPLRAITAALGTVERIINYICEHEALAIAA